jgi:hypothetical protein
MMASKGQNGPKYLVDNSPKKPNYGLLYWANYGPKIGHLGPQDKVELAEKYFQIGPKD